MKIPREQRLLRKVGFPIKVDGDVGPQTRQARSDFKRGAPWPYRQTRAMYLRRLRWSAKRGGGVSKHFRYREFASKGNGWIKVTRRLVVGLEKLRKKVGPIAILSAYRDPKHNASVGGASKSTHVEGAAIDPVKSFPFATVRNLNQFSGIGYIEADGRWWVRHVDVRGQQGVANHTGGTRKAPTTWRYN